MSKHNRTEVVKVLRQQMEAATDPREKVELAKQLAKLLPKPRQARRPRRPETRPKNKKVSILDGVTGDSFVDTLSDGKKVFYWLVVEFEKRRKLNTGKAFDDAERSAVWDELMSGLSARESEALNALTPADLDWRV